MGKRKPEITKHEEICYFCKGVGCKRCNNGRVTLYFTIIDGKGNAVIADTLK